VRRRKADIEEKMFQHGCTSGFRRGTVASGGEGRQEADNKDKVCLSFMSMVNESQTAGGELLSTAERRRQGLADTLQDMKDLKGNHWQRVISRMFSNDAQKWNSMLGNVICLHQLHHYSFYHYPLIKCWCTRDFFRQDVECARANPNPSEPLSDT
jgi:hypothetical protein